MRRRLRPMESTQSRGPTCFFLQGASLPGTCRSILSSGLGIDVVGFTYRVGLGFTGQETADRKSQAGAAQLGHGQAASQKKLSR